MAHYLAEIDLPAELSEEFLALIPRQRAQVEKLFTEGTLLSYSLSADRTRLWAIFTASSELEVSEILATFPLHPYIHSHIHELFFTQHAGTTFPAVSLN